jgi:succinyl-CoA synthetase beta subunit
MNIHEYQAKALLHEFGVPISKGVPVLRASDSDVAAKTLPGPIWVVKSQIHAGGRGKGKFKEASAGSMSRKAPTSTRSSISRSWSTAKRPKCRSWRRPKAA